jgi:hypothetical protein
LLIIFINFHHLHQISSSSGEKSCEENCEQDDDDEDHDPFYSHLQFYLFCSSFSSNAIIKCHHLHVTNLVKKIVNKKKKIDDPFYSHLEFYLFALQMDYLLHQK